MGFAEKKLKLKLKILRRRILDEENFFAGEEYFFVETSKANFSSVMGPKLHSILG